MAYDFDRVIDRRGTNAVAYEKLPLYFNTTDAEPFWVADSGFATPPFIIDALRRRLEHPIFGYTIEAPQWRPALVNWLRERQNWHIEPQWLAFIPGIVKGIGMAINALTSPGDKIIIQPPVYHPFRIVPESNGRRVVFNPLRELPDGGYEMDFDHLARIADSDCKMLILCNPHNPAGIVWPVETLRRLARFCKERNIIVISDEIHCDMPLFGAVHTPFATVSPDAASNSITFQAPSKTFNIAGIVSSFAVVPDPELRKRFFGWLEANELCDPDIFAPIATIAAYSPEGEQWRRQLIAYLEENIDFTIDYLRREIPAIKPLRPGASFLIWLDCRDLGLPQQQLVDLFVKKAKLALNDGTMFGPGGEGHMRFNIGFPRQKIADALQKLRNAIISQ